MSATQTMSRARGCFLCILKIEHNIASPPAAAHKRTSTHQTPPRHLCACFAQGIQHRESANRQTGTATLHSLSCAYRPPAKSRIATRTLRSRDTIDYGSPIRPKTLFSSEASALFGTLVSPNRKVVIADPRRRNRASPSHVRKLARWLTEYGVTGGFIFAKMDPLSLYIPIIAGYAFISRSLPTTFVDGGLAHTPRHAGEVRNRDAGQSVTPALQTVGAHNNE